MGTYNFWLLDYTLGSINGATKYSRDEIRHQMRAWSEGEVKN